MPLIRDKRCVNDLLPTSSVSVCISLHLFVGVCVHECMCFCKLMTASQFYFLLPSFGQFAFQSHKNIISRALCFRRINSICFQNYYTCYSAKGKRILLVKYIFRHLIKSLIQFCFLVSVHE